MGVTYLELTKLHRWYLLKMVLEHPPSRQPVTRNIMLICHFSYNN